MNQITGQGVQPQSPGFSAAESRLSSGTLSGRVARILQTPESVLQDAAEELNASMDRSVACSVEKLRERDRNRLRSDRARAYMAAVRKKDDKDGTEGADRPDPADTALTDLLRTADAERIVKEELSTSDSPEEAWSHLVLFRERHGAHQELDQAIALLEERHGEEIRTGIAGALAADTHPVSYAGAAELGREYSRTVLEFTGAQDLYTRIRATHREHFHEALDFLERAVTYDLGSTDPSVDPKALASLNRSIGLVRLMRSGAELCEKVAATEEGVDADRLLTELLRIGSAPYPSAQDVLQLADSSGKVRIEERIHFLQKLLTCVRGFSPALFDDPDGRNRLIACVQAGVDRAVEREDELLAGS